MSCSRSTVPHDAPKWDRKKSNCPGLSSYKARCYVRARSILAMVAAQVEGLYQSAWVPWLRLMVEMSIGYMVIADVSRLWASRVDNGLVTAR